MMEKGVLSIFDVDGTLFNSEAKVNVLKNGTIIHELDTAEKFNNYSLKSDEEFDFSDFDCGKHFYNTAKPLNKMIELAKSIVHFQSTRCRSIIITARNDMSYKDMFLSTFRKHGFPIDRVYVERAGKLTAKYELGKKTHISKGVIIKQHLSTGNYNRIRMWDDQENNLRMLLKISKFYPEVSFEAYLVDPITGNTRRYE